MKIREFHNKAGTFGGTDDSLADAPTATLQKLILLFDFIHFKKVLGITQSSCLPYDGHILRRYGHHCPYTVQPA